MKTGRELVKLLREHGRTGHPGRMGHECVVEKSFLNEVADRLEELVSEQNTTIVVRCKNCKFSKWVEKEGQRYCTRKWAMHRVRERDYCSYGIREM